MSQRMRKGALLVSLFVAACGGSNKACLDYTDANAACIQDAEDAGLPVDVDTSDPEGFCEEFADWSDERWDCLAKAYRAADCTTEDGLAAALAEADKCPQ